MPIPVPDPPSSQGLRIHYTNNSAVWSLKVGDNYTCADPLTPGTANVTAPTYSYATLGKGGNVFPGGDFP